MNKCAASIQIDFYSRVHVFIEYYSVTYLIIPNPHGVGLARSQTTHFPDPRRVVGVASWWRGVKDACDQTAARLLFQQ